MSSEIVMPKLSDTMEEGKIIRWLKHPGDQVHHGDALAEVETDKADMVMESFEEGILAEIRLKEGESAHVGATIAVLRAAGESVASSAASPAPEAGAVKVEAPKVTAVRSPERVTPLRGAKRRRGSNGSEAEESPAEAEPVAARPSAEVADANSAEVDEEAGGFPVSRDFHPALSGHPSAAPTAIAAPPARAIAVTTTPH